MGLRIPTLEIKSLLESNPLKSRILVQRLAVRGMLLLLLLVLLLLLLLMILSSLSLLLHVQFLLSFGSPRVSIDRIRALRPCLADLPAEYTPRR